MQTRVYVWMVRMPFKRSRSALSPPPGFLGLTPLSSDTTALSKSYLKLGLQIVR